MDVKFFVDPKNRGKANHGKEFMIVIFTGDDLKQLADQNSIMEKFGSLTRVDWIGFIEFQSETVIVLRGYPQRLQSVCERLQLSAETALKKNDLPTFENLLAMYSQIPEDRICVFIDKSKSQQKQYAGLLFFLFRSKNHSAVESFLSFCQERRSGVSRLRKLGEDTIVIKGYYRRANDLLSHMSEQGCPCELYELDLPSEGYILALHALALG